jgi:pimeloyl-ACP methyl ester carboxylesterase
MNHASFLFFLIFVLSAAPRISAQVPYGDNPAAGHYIVLNGVQHYYEQYGSGKPLVLIHGNGTPTRGWAKQIDYFSKRYTVYSIDSRGRGKSDLGTDTLSFMNLAKDVAALIEQLQLDSVAIVGKSDGGVIGLLMGIHYPAHISKIVAFAPNLHPDETAFFPETIKEIHNERVKADKMLAAGDTTMNWKVEQQRYRLNEFQPHISAKDLQKIQAPVLVLAGDRDLIKEEHILFIYRNIPKAHLCILPGETHSLPKNNPGLFNQMTDKFLSEPYREHTYRFAK